MRTPFARSLLACALAILTWPTFAGTGNVDYRVQVGDTLSGIAHLLLARASLWPKLQEINRLPDPNRLAPGSTVLIPAYLLRRNTVPALVTHIVGDVRQDSEPLAEGATVGESTTITTGDNAFAAIRTADGSLIRLQPRSIVELRTTRALAGDRAHDVRLELKQGRLESDVAKVKPGLGRFEISAPLSTIGIRGTRLRVASDDPTSSTIELVEGRLQVRSGPGGAFALRAGQGTVVHGEAHPQVRDLLAAPDLLALPALQERVKIGFTFPAVAGAEHYRVQLAVDDDFSQIVAEGVFAQPQAKFAGLDDGRYRVRVRGIDADGIEGRDGESAFTLKARPEPPFAQAPRPGGKEVGSSVEFAWTAGNVAAYRLQLSTTPDFADKLVDANDVHDTRLTAAGPFPPATYYWRIGSTRADGDLGPWSDVMSFVLKAPTEAQPPRLAGNRLAFAWSGEAGQVFDFELAHDPDFRAPLLAQRLDKAEVEIAKPSAGTYYMRVRAIDADGFVGPYSATQRVEVPLPWWPLLFLVAPLL
jgi:hypothetical protein